MSILLPVYNAETYIQEAIESILEQTYTNFELIILNDGSRDNSKQIIQTIKDERIVYVEHENIGLAATLNKGITLSKADLIARQDQDDVSLKDRIAKQVAFLQNNPNVHLLGTQAVIINEKGESKNRFHKHPIQNIELKFSLLFDNPFVHSSVMFRKQAVIEVGVYDTSATIFEDYNLWSRLARKFELANLAEVLCKYREVDSSISRSTPNYQLRVMNQSKENILNCLQETTQTNLDLFLNKVYGPLQNTHIFSDLSYISSYLQLIAKGFAKNNRVDDVKMKAMLELQTLNCRKAYLNSILNSKSEPIFKKLLAKILRRINQKKFSTE